MLNPVDLPRVISDDRVHGTYPEHIHDGVAWWIGSCLILMTQAHGVAVVHDGQDLSRQFAERFAQGAINCKHYGATVSMLGAGSEELLAYGIRTLQVPGVLITADDSGSVSMRLFTAEGKEMGEDTGLSRIREVIARDQVPIPVNETSKGRILRRDDLTEQYAVAEG